MKLAARKSASRSVPVALVVLAWVFGDLELLRLTDFSMWCSFRLPKLMFFVWSSIGLALLLGTGMSLVVDSLDKHRTKISMPRLRRPTEVLEARSNRFPTSNDGVSRLW